ncbi:MAG: ParA family protein [Planctomycetes bacterium]|nr:ParA family protein [Planctomycetota bacterium]
MRIITIANPKGGCAKTTTAVNLAYAMALDRARVLLVDLDPQAHATLGLGCWGEKLPQTLYDLLVHPDVEAQSLVCETTLTHLHLLPCNSKLAKAQVELTDVLGKEMVLAEKLRALKDDYDLCIVDSPPGHGLLSTCALVCATDIIVPIQPHFYAYQGLQRTLDRISTVKERFYPCDINLLGLAMTLVDDRSVMTKRIRALVHERFADLAFDCEIHCNVAVSQAPESGCSVLAFDPQSRGAREYKALAAEVRGRLSESA